MSIKKEKTIILVVLLFGIFGSCVEVGELLEDRQSVELGAADSVEVRIKMSAGEMFLHGGAEELMEGYFAYNVESWKPEVDYSISGRQGLLRIEQEKRRGIPFGDSENRWEIDLGEDIPLEIRIDFGAGEGHLDMRGLDLRRLDVDMGVGELTVDLTGRRKHDLRMKIDGGIGSATLNLPEEIGVRVLVEGGIGSVDAHGMNKSDHTYTNDAYGRTDVTIEVEIDAGIGSVDLRLK
jgi:hypothetical protein